MRTEQLVERMVGSALGALDVWSTAIGDALGLYRALHVHGPLTPEQLAGRAPIDARYAREWLEQQVAAGFLERDGAAFALPPEHVPVLDDPDDPSYLAPLSRLLAAAGVQLPALLTAYRTGGGVPWSAYGEGMRTGQADLNRPWYLGPLGTEWLPALPELDAALRAGARVADVGCGEGWSSIGIARAYPESVVDGFDLDAPSVAAASAHARDEGLSDRLTFAERDVATLPAGSYDVVRAFECVHDLADPVRFLAAVRRLVRPDGFVLVMDERVPERPGEGSDDELLVERLMYGFSLMVCLPDGMSHRPSAATGTVMRLETLQRYAVEAGFEAVEVLPIANDLWRFHRLVL
ncbi:class I SAM-dependent methyltransferase [Angustibacter aerolatus]